MAEAGSSKVDCVVGRRDEGRARFRVGNQAEHEVGQQAPRVGSLEEDAVCVEACLLEKGRVAGERNGVNGDLVVRRGEDGVHGGDVLGRVGVGDGDDDDAALDGRRGGGVDGGCVGERGVG